MSADEAVNNEQKEGDAMRDLNEFLKDFGLQLKKRRKAMGLSQVNAAHQMKIDYRHYQNIEGGKINLRLDTFLKLIDFYQLSDKDRPFDVDVCVNLLSGLNSKEEAHLAPGLDLEGEAPSPDAWSSMYHNFVEGGQAGFISIDCRTGLIQQVNDKLISVLGYRSSANLINRNFNNIFVKESADRLQEFLAERSPGKVSKPFMATLKTQPPAYPVSMMALLRSKKDLATGEEHLHVIVLDRRVMDSESKRVRDLLVGPQPHFNLGHQFHAVS